MADFMKIINEYFWSERYGRVLLLILLLANAMSIVP